jgi:hypothetical protein
MENENDKFKKLNEEDYKRLWANDKQLDEDRKQKGDEYEFKRSGLYLREIRGWMRFFGVVMILGIIDRIIAVLMGLLD